MHLKWQFCDFINDFVFFHNFRFLKWTQRMLTPAHPKYRFFHYFGYRGGWGAKMWVSPWKLVYISSKYYKLTFWWFCSDLVDFWNFRFFCVLGSYYLSICALQWFWRGLMGEKTSKNHQKSIQTPLKHPNESSTPIEIGLCTGGKFLVWSICGSCRKSHIMKSAFD